MFIEKRISDLFHIYPGTGVSALEYMEGKIPYISESAVNNGIRFFINPNQIVKNLVVREKIITVGSKTGVAFYHPYKCVVGQQTAGLQLKETYDSEDLDYIYMYLLSLIEAQTRVKASFGYQVSTEKLPYIKLIVPIVDELLDVDFIKNEINRFSSYISIPEIKEEKTQQLNCSITTKWEIRILGDMFDSTELYSATTYDENKLSDEMKLKGLIPYVTRTSENNGIKLFLSEDPKYSKMIGNCITIGLDTQTVFYQKNDFYSGQNIIILRPKHINKYNGIFLASILERELKKFSWGSNGATLSRLKRLKIMVPVDNKGVLDYNYMNSYVKNMKYSCNL